MSDSKLMIALQMVPDVCVNVTVCVCEMEVNTCICADCVSDLSESK